MGNSSLAPFPICWNGGSWVDVPGGAVTANNLVWRQFNFTPLTTDRIRVLVNGAFGSYARIAELEAWGTAASGGAGGGGGGATPAAGIYFIEADHLETPRLISNAQQQVVWRWDQAEPFGDTPPNDNPSNLGTFEFNLRFPGQYRDKETNLNYNFFRDYDPNLGRYVQSDPIGLRGGINTYSYVKGNPMSQTDATGLEPGTTRQRGYNIPRQCPSRPPVGDPSWQRYPKRSGEEAFHCGFKCFQEARRPEPDWLQGECCYDDQDTLVDVCHLYSGCKGTPNQYEQSDPRHIFPDSGGVVSSGWDAFWETRRYTSEKRGK